MTITDYLPFYIGQEVILPDGRVEKLTTGVLHAIMLLERDEYHQAVKLRLKHLDDLGDNGAQLLPWPPLAESLQFKIRAYAKITARWITLGYDVFHLIENGLAERI